MLGVSWCLLPSFVQSQSLEVQVASLGQELIAASGNQQKVSSTLRVVLVQAQSLFPVWPTAAHLQSEGRVAELEAAKDQMEQDLFNSQQALQTLQQSERKVGTHRGWPSWSVLLAPHCGLPLACGLFLLDTADSSV